MPTYSYSLHGLRWFRPVPADGRGGRRRGLPGLRAGGPARVRCPRAARRSTRACAAPWTPEHRSADAPEVVTSVPAAGRTGRPSGASPTRATPAFPARDRSRSPSSPWRFIPCPTSCSASTRPSRCATRPCPATTAGTPTSRRPPRCRPGLVDPHRVPGVDRRPDRQQRLGQRRPRRRPRRLPHAVRPDRDRGRRARRPARRRHPRPRPGARRRSATRPARAGATPASSPSSTAAASSPTSSRTPTRRSGTSAGRRRPRGTSRASATPASPTPACSAPRPRPSCWPGGTRASGR